LGCPLLFKLPILIHISNRLSEIRSEQGMSKHRQILMGILTRSSHDDFRPMFTYLELRRSQH